MKKKASELIARRGELGAVRQALEYLIRTQDGSHPYGMTENDVWTLAIEVFNATCPFRPEKTP